jgi:hypothetical protein
MEEGDLDNILLLASPAPELHITEIKAEKPKKSTRRINDDVRAKVKEALKTGKSVREVAADLNISKSTVSTISKEKGPSPSDSTETIQILSTDPVDKMDDAAFAKAIGSGPSVTEAEVQPPTPSEKANFLKKFMGELDDPVAPAKKTRQPKLAAEPQPSMLLTELRPAEPEVDRTVYIAKIQMNVDNFADVLKDQIKPDRDGFLTKVSKMGPAELQQTLKLLETVRSSNNLANQLKYLLYGAANIIEMGTQRFLRMQTQGYAHQVRQQEAEIQSCLREIAINNVESYKKVERPEMRLATVLVTTLLATDSRNRLEAVRSEFKARPVNPETAKQYEEL